MSRDFESMPMREVIEANRNGFGHFFDVEARRYFRSRVPDYAIRQDGYAYFVTSEKFDDATGRKWTIRFMCLECGTIDSIGEFQKYLTGKAARTALRSVLLNDEKPHIETFHHHKVQLQRIVCTNAPKKEAQ